MWRYVENKEKYGSEIAIILFDFWFRFYTTGPCKDLQKNSLFKQHI